MKSTCRIDSYGKINVVSLSGSWYEMGRQFGKLADKQLNDVYSFCEQIIAAQSGNSKKADSIIKTQTAQMPYTIRSFFKGASET